VLDVVVQEPGSVKPWIGREVDLSLADEPEVEPAGRACR
jgi:hypothetical protein